MLFNMMVGVQPVGKNEGSASGTVPGGGLTTMPEAELHERQRAVSLVPAIDRAAAILDLLADHDGLPVTVSDLARTLHLPKSSTANLCAALVETGLAARRDTGFVLGRKLAELGGRYLSTVDEISEFYNLCRRSPILSRETVRASVLDGLDVLYLARHDGKPPLRLTANIGDRFPATCTATGKAMLATLDPAVLHDRLQGISSLPALTAKSLTSLPALLAHLETVRARGWAIDDEETTMGITCFAVPVGPPGTPARFAISVTLLTSRLEQELSRDDLLEELRIVAKGMTSPLQPPV
jgi:DNA-binding IclR family transcriptional regulator